MKRLLVLFVLILTVVFSYTAIAQEMGAMRKGLGINFPEKIQKLVLDPLPAGTYSIGTGGYFPTIDSAFNKLSVDGIAGEVTLELIDELYTAPTNQYGFFLNGPIPGAGPNSGVTIFPNFYTGSTVEGSGATTFTFLNTSYIKLMGYRSEGVFAIHTLSNNMYSHNDGIIFQGNSDNNILSYLYIINEDYIRGGVGIGLWGSSTAQEACDSNLIQSNWIGSSGTGIYINTISSLKKAEGNIIRWNTIGSEGDSLIQAGIQAENAKNTIIENNYVENIRYYGNNVLISGPIFGINSYWGEGDIIRNNIVHNIHASNNLYGSNGIGLSGSAGQYGNNNSVYNNMVYDIRSSSSQPNSSVAGIQMWCQINPKIYYNSVYLSGTGSNPLGSAAFRIFTYGGNSSNVNLKNNILVNTRDESPYCATAIYDYTAANLSSDYNDLYYEPNGNNCLVRIGNTDYLALADWQAQGKDLHSYDEMPHFISLNDLHIDETIPTYLESRGTPVVGIDIDFDGDTRNATTPDIGADEFELVNPQYWQLQNSNFPTNITASNFSPVSDLFCWAGGLTSYNQVPYPGFIRTINGGNTWTCDSIPSIPNGLISQVFAIDADTAYMAVYVLTSSSSKGIYKTTDGGDTWSRQNAYNSAFYGPGYIHFFDANNGVVVGDPNLETYTTTNGGQTWNQISMPSAPDEYTWVGGTGITGYGNSVWFCSTKRLFHSTDRGNTWTISTNIPAFNMLVPCLAFQDENTGIFSLENYNAQSYIYRKTTDGGLTWTILSNTVLDNISPTCIIHIPGTTSTYLVSGGRDYGKRGLAATFNAGENWVLWDTVGCLSIGFSSVQSGWGNPYPTWQVYKYIGPSITTVEEEVIDVFPTDYSISQNYPNPFNPSTTFRYSIPTQSKVVIKVYDILGNEIATLMDEEKSVGTYELTWNAASLSSGIYFYQLNAGEFVSTKNMILLK
jgi:hypothetical protein